MSKHEVISLLQSIEEQFPVDRWYAHGIPVWPFLRIHLALKLIDQQVSAISTPLASGQSSPAPSSPSAQKTFNIDHLEREYDILCFGATGFKTELNGLWFDRFVDSLKMLMPSFSAFTMDFGVDVSKQIPYAYPTEQIQQHLDQINKEWNQNGFIPEYELEGYDDFRALVLERYPYLDVYELPRVITNALLIRDYADFFKLVIHKIKPKMIFMVCYYSYAAFALNLAARECGVPSVDIQHGAGSEDRTHYAYSLWTKVPAQGYSILPRYFWCWQETGVETIRSWSTPYSAHHQPLRLGNPWLSIWKQENSNLNIQDESLDLSPYRAQGYQAFIIVTLQPGIGMHQTIFQSIVDSPKEYFWFVRLHPRMKAETPQLEGEIRQLLADQKIAHAIIDPASRFPLLMRLAQVDVHVTAYSSSIIEASEFGVVSVTTHENGPTMYKAYADRGHLLYARSSEEVLSAIGQCLAQKQAGHSSQQKPKADNPARMMETMIQQLPPVNLAPADADQLAVRQAQLWLTARRFEAIIERYSTESHPLLQLYVGKSYIAYNEPARAKQHFERWLTAIDYSVDHPDFRFESLRIYWKLLEDLHQADELQHLKLRIDPQLLTVPRALGLWLNGFNQHREWERILAYADYDHFDTLFFSGKALKYTQQSELAKDKLTAFVDNFDAMKTSSQSRNNFTNNINILAIAYLELGELHLADPAKACGYFAKCMQLSSGKNQTARAYLEKFQAVAD